MITIVVEHARRHVISYLALVCALLALGGAAYAQFRIPTGAVGERQLHNQVIDPIKWDPIYTAGFLRRWATVSASGSIMSTSPHGQSAAKSSGYVEVTWGDAFAGWCAPIATVISPSASRPPTVPTTTTTTTTTPTTTPTTATTTSTTTTKTTTTSTTSSTTSTPPPPPSKGAYADASIVRRSGLSTLVAIATYNAQGQPTPEPVSVAVVCGPGAGNGQLFPTSLP
jgi:hypothetical protein